MLTQERQLLLAISDFMFRKKLREHKWKRIYRRDGRAKKAYDKIAEELPEEAQYVVPMAYNIHWYFHVNFALLQWLCELRSSPAGHPGYRYVAQEMAKQVSTVIPAFERFFKFVDYDGYELGRLGQEISSDQKTEMQLNAGLKSRAFHRRNASDRRELHWSWACSLFRS